MPNTQPAMDTAQNVRLLKDIIKKDALCNVFMTGAITQGRLGKELTDLKAMKSEGIIAITDDGSSVDDETIMSAALKEAKKNNLLTICHSEDKSLSAKGVVNLSFTSTRLGLRGISNESEYKRVERDIRLAESANAAIHIAHVSTKESVGIIARAKKKGLKVTCETAPHYFSLSENDVLDYDTNKKMNPPLRSQKDSKAVKEALINGVIDIIASDHAPHTENEKEIEFDRAEFGVIGLETILAVSSSELLKEGSLDWPDLVKKLSLGPAKILGINKGTLSVKSDADIIVVAPLEEWLVEKKTIVSKSKNCSFINKKLRGIVDYTICGGEIVFKRNQKV
jgi:dihydroorotase